MPFYASFNLSLEKVIRDTDVNARAIILFKSILLVAYADDIHSFRATRDILFTFIRIEQAVIGARFSAAH